MAEIDNNNGTMTPCTQVKRIEKIEYVQNTDHVQITEIRNCLLGDEYHPDDGFINKFARTDKKVDDLQRTMTQFKTWITAAVTIIGIVFTLLQFVLNYIEKSKDKKETPKQTTSITKNGT